MSSALRCFGLDGKMGHVWERPKKPVTHSPVPQSSFPMAHSGVLPDLIESPEKAPEWRHTCCNRLIVTKTFIPETLSSFFILVCPCLWWKLFWPLKFHNSIFSFFYRVCILLKVLRDILTHVNMRNMHLITALCMNSVKHLKLNVCKGNVHKGLWYVSWYWVICNMITIFKTSFI